MATFVLVPGGWKGSWSYEAVVPLLERAGHTVHALTLTGLWPDDDIATVATANLDTHADDVVRLLDRARVTGATLVGHSYGGMVIAAAADRAGGRISRLVHLDAYVPRDGESCWSSTNEHFRQVFAAGAASTGYTVRPPATAIPAAVPIPSPRSSRRSGSQARTPRSRAGSSSTARGGRTGRRSPSSATGSEPIPSGRSTTSPPATTPCTRPRMRSPHSCSPKARRTHRRTHDGPAGEGRAGPVRPGAPRGQRNRAGGYPHLAHAPQAHHRQACQPDSAVNRSTEGWRTQPHHHPNTEDQPCPCPAPLPTAGP